MVFEPYMYININNSHRPLLFLLVYDDDFRIVINTFDKFKIVLNLNKFLLTNEIRFYNVTVT